MRKPENKRSKTKSSPSGKVYRKTEKKSTVQSRIEKANHARVEGNRKAKLVPIAEVAERLEIKQGEEITCPSCQQEKLKVNHNTNSFHCPGCKKKGHGVHLVRYHLDVSYWQAVRYINEAENGQKPSPEKNSQEKIELQPSAKEVTPEIASAALQKAGEQTAKAATSIPQNKSSLEREQHLKERVAKAKQSHRLEDVIEREAGVKYKRAGTNLMCRCPFADHEDKTPSFAVNTDEQLFHCFGCGRGGDMFTFLIEYRGFKFIEALDYIDGGKEHSPRSIPALIPDKVSASRLALVQLLARCQDFFHSRLCESEVAKAFLQERGLYNAELASHFKLGFDDGKINQTLSPEVAELLKELGMLNDKGNCSFYRCLTVGLSDIDGNVLGIYGRRISSNNGSKHQFPRSKVEGILNARAFVASRELIITEGAIDAFSLWIMGFRHVSCIFSASFIPPLLIELIESQQIERVCLALDNDKQGEKACRNLCEKLPNIDVRRVRFPAGIKDANELLVQLGREQGRACFQKLLSEAKPIGPKSCSSSLVASSYTGSLPVEIGAEDIKIVIEDRHYRVRGLAKNLSFDSLRVNVRVLLLDRFHIDTLELYNARQRSSFIKTASVELGVKPEVIKRDIGRILLKLEELQEQNIRETIKPKTKEVVLTDKERSEALVLLKAPDLLERLKQDFVRCGLVGEEINVLVCFLALVSRKLDDPLAVIIQALSAAGKTALMSMALSFMPEEDVVKFTAMTGQSLFYLGEEDLVHKVLAISEEQGAEKASYAIKLLQSEKSLSIASTGKSPKDGRFVTHEYKVQGPTQIILTTTAVEIDEELQNRCLLLTVSEDQEQTKAIHRRQRQKETLGGKLQEQDKEHITKLYQNAQRLLRPLVVVNPYAENLTFLDTKPRTRRDNLKYLTLIRAIALLHQYQRPIKKVTHRGKVVEYIEASLDDIKVANLLIAEIMGHSLDELSPQTRRFLSILLKMVKEHCQKQGIKQPEYHFTRKTIRDYSGWSDFQVRTHLNCLVELEYVLIRAGNRGSRHLYELLYQGEGDLGNRFLLGLIDVDGLKNGQGEHRKDKGVGENDEGKHR